MPVDQLAGDTETLAPVYELYIVGGIRCRNGEQRYEGGPGAVSDGTQAYLSLPDVPGEDRGDIWLAEPEVLRQDERLAARALRLYDERDDWKARVTKSLAILDHPSLTDRGEKNSDRQALAAQLRAILDPASVPTPNAQTLTVTVSVDPDDIQSVLSWAREGEVSASTTAGRLLRAYASRSEDTREDVFQAMPASLQWCVHTLEHEGVGRLVEILEAAGDTEMSGADS